MDKTVGAPIYHYGSVTIKTMKDGKKEGKSDFFSLIIIFTANISWTACSLLCDNLLSQEGEDFNIANK